MFLKFADLVELNELNFQQHIICGKCTSFPIPTINDGTGYKLSLLF